MFVIIVKNKIIIFYIVNKSIYFVLYFIFISKVKSFKGKYKIF